MILKTDREAEYALLSFDVDRRQAAIALKTDNSVSRVAQDFEEAERFFVFRPDEQDAIEEYRGYTTILNITNQGGYYLLILERGDD